MAVSMILRSTKYVTFEYLLHAAFVADTMWGVDLEPACIDIELINVARRSCSTTAAYVLSCPFQVATVGVFFLVFSSSAYLVRNKLSVETVGSLRLIVDTLWQGAREIE